MLRELGKNLKNEKGQMALVTVVTILAAGVVLVAALGILTFNEIKKINNVEKSEQSYYAAEAGIEDAILRVRRNMSYPTSPTTYTLSVGSSTATVEITLPLENLNIISIGDSENRIRKVAVNMNATPSNINSNFNYGVQVGAGGLVMAANSKVLGNVYSNGKIEGASSHPEIIGDAFSAGGLIDLMDIVKTEPAASDGNGHSNTINNSNMEGTPFCKFGAGNNKLCTPASDPSNIPLPLTPEDIEILQNQAASGGEQSTTTISGSGNTLGPRKIDGDLIISSNSELTVTGTIWVTGDITLNSNILIKLDPAFGTDSGAFVATEEIVIDSNVTVCGSDGGSGNTCNPNVSESYIMFLSTSTSSSSSDPAISMSANTDAAILYSSAGLTKVNANTDVFEITAFQLEIESNASVSYVSGLADTDFSSGPGGVFSINSWKEVQ
ncbi:hypothetical protein IID23_04980 [Patescibacteria group bacterium]|nr:hypothetical protein [Patescibacteria group bacterium]